IRSLIARVGAEAGVDALYWRGGVTAYEAGTRSHLLIEQVTTGDWSGEIRLRTRGGDAARLLGEAIRWVEEEQARFGLVPTSAPDRNLRASPVHVAQEAPPSDFKPDYAPAPADKPLWFVSYAWGDDRSPEGIARERAIEAFCTAAVARGVEVERDTNVMRLGDSIQAFMRRAGERNRVPMILSAKYFRSIPCMTELHTVWHAADGRRDAFMRRARPLVLPDAKFSQPEQRIALNAEWVARYDALAALIEKPGGARSVGEEDFALFRRMSRFIHDIPAMLATLADSVYLTVKESPPGSGGVDAADLAAKIDRLIDWCLEDDPA
ncbi:MAG: toll/interleukin-1 receptor domain-containing protein, partial [Acetobacteraceae bacterium]|nr:toll/interleukin-1 receptor domain-containing protein [Acetobacteraceae bacterium]